MKALVVFESMWGNTGQVAQAIASGLSGSMDVDVVEVAQAPAEPASDVGLLVVGGPTHAFAMSRSSTRSDAHRQGATHGNSETGIREWLDGLPRGDHPQLVATFDTRVDKVRRLPGSAAKSAARAAARHGYQRAAHAESFFVSDTAGPLIDGELERASAWGRTLATAARPQQIAESAERGERPR